MTVESAEIRQQGLDTVTVFWRNWEPGKGEVTIHCYGSAWTAYFNAMAGNTIQQFFARASVDYLVIKLTDARFQKHTKAHEKYLAQIVGAIKAHYPADTTASDAKEGM